MKKNETETAQLSKVRAEIRTETEALATVLGRPANSGEIVKRLEAAFSEVRETADKQLLRVAAHTTAAEFHREFSGASLAKLLQDLIAVAVQQQLLTSVQTALDRLLGSDGISDAARAEQIAARTHRLEILNAEEEMLLEALETGGVTVTRRPDVDPAVVLGFRNGSFDGRKFERLRTRARSDQSALHDLGTRIADLDRELSRTRSTIDAEADRGRGVGVDNSKHIAQLKARAETLAERKAELARQRDEIASTASCSAGLVNTMGEFLRQKNVPID